tara:strand:+ start:13363 stop:13968 length:606 start_codon:yes stop_codon:yes gene_type:complete
MHFEVRKVVTSIEETRIEGGKLAPRPITMVGVAYVIKNPWAGQGFVENLRPEITAGCSELGAEMVAKILAHFPSGEAIEAYGKAAVIGLAGEIEHASGLIHTLRFGNHYRDAVNAKSFLSFTNKRGPAGTSIQIPMMHKDDAGFRSHYITLEMHIEDAPAADEIIVVLGGADGGRAHPRIGNRYMDMEEIAAEKAALEAQL